MEDLLLRRREILMSDSVTLPNPIFYASLIDHISPEIIDAVHNYTYSTLNASSSSSGLTLNVARYGSGYVKFNPLCTPGIDMTFSCWVYRTGDGGGVNYSFGTATPRNARSIGLQTTWY